MFRSTARSAGFPRLTDRRHLFVGTALVALVAIATQPLWSTSHLLFSDDGRMYFFRLIAFDQAVRQGVVYPRWLPDLMFGYGYPILNYFSPLDLYLAETLHILGLGFVGAFKMGIVVAAALAASGAYAMAFELFDDCIAAVLTALVYLFAPFTMWDIYSRGGAPEFFAAAILVWLLWALRRGFKTPAPATFVLISLLLAALLLAHIATLVILVPLLCAFVLFELKGVPGPLRLARLRWIVAAVGLAMGLGAVYWLPMVVELSWVRIGDASSGIATAFYTSLSAASDLVQSAFAYRYEFNGNAPLGLATVVLAVIALVFTSLSRSWRGRSVVLFFGLVALVTAVARIDLARGVWAAIPGVGTVQFPWRLNIVIDLGLAVTIGALPAVVSHRVSRHPWTADRRLSPRFVDAARLLTLLAVGGAVVWTSTAELSPQEMNYPSPSTKLTVADLISFEGYSGFAGTSSFDAYLPETVTVPLTLGAVESDRSAPSATIVLDRYTPTERELTTSATDALTVTLRAFYMPDWQATVDGIPAATFPNTAIGLLATLVPPGEHRVVFFQGDTPARCWGTRLSVASLLITAFLCGLACRRRNPRGRTALTVLGALLGVMWIPGLAAHTAATVDLEPKEIAVSPELNIIGLTIEAARRDGPEWHLADLSTLAIRLYWHVKDSVAENPLTWRLVDSDGRAWILGAPMPRLGTGFVQDWIANEVVEDYYQLPLASAVGPGRYDLQVSMGEGQSYVSAATIVLPRATPALAGPPDLAHMIDASVGDLIKLLGGDWQPVARPGGSYAVSLYWSATRTVHANYAAFVQLLDSQGQSVAQRDSLSGIGIVPTSMWIPGRVIVQDEKLDLPGDLLPGLYTLIAGLYDNPNIRRLPVTDAQGGPSPDDVVELGQVKVPMQAQDARPAHPLSAMLDDTIRLLGYDLHEVGNDVKLTLFWRAQTHLDADYKVFVHILDARENLAVQVDGFPGMGLYPTSLWDAGETIVDEYEWSREGLSPGRYRILVGMYSPETGERLVLRDPTGKELPDREVEVSQIQIAPSVP